MRPTATARPTVKRYNLACGEANQKAYDDDDDGANAANKADSDTADGEINADSDVDADANDEVQNFKHATTNLLDET